MAHHGECNRLFLSSRLSRQPISNISYHWSNEPKHPIIPNRLQKNICQDTADRYYSKSSKYALNFFISVPKLNIFLGSFVDKFQHFMCCYMIICMRDLPSVLLEVCFLLQLADHCHMRFRYYHIRNTLKFEKFKDRSRIFWIV